MEVKDFSFLQIQCLYWLRGGGAGAHDAVDGTGERKGRLPSKPSGYTENVLAVPRAESHNGCAWKDVTYISGVAIS